MDTELIWESVQKAALLKYISYSHGRLSRRKIKKTLPEIIRSLETFGRGSLQDWNDEMLHHNALLRRGASMRLCRHINVARLIHCSLDMYMLHVRSDAVAEALENFLAFGRRMIPLIRRNPDSDDWQLSAEISIQRRHWYKLCLKMMNLVHLLGFGQLDKGEWSESQPIICDKSSKLFTTVRGMQEVFGGFADADANQSSLQQLYARGTKPVASV
jgi:hypothetical protein